MPGDRIAVCSPTNGSTRPCCALSIRINGDDALAIEKRPICPIIIIIEKESRMKSENTGSVLADEQIVLRRTMDSV